VVIFTQKNTCTVTGYLYNGNHIKVINVNYIEGNQYETIR